MRVALLLAYVVGTCVVGAVALLLVAWRQAGPGEPLSYDMKNGVICYTYNHETLSCVYVPGWKGRE